MKMRRSTQEKILRPAIVANYVPLIETVADDFVDQLRKTQMINDLHKELTNYTSESKFRYEYKFSFAL